MMDLPIEKDIELSKSLLTELRDLVTKFLTEAEIVSSNGIYGKLPTRIKVSMLMVAIQMLYNSTELADPKLFALAKGITDLGTKLTEKDLTKKAGNSNNKQ